MQNDTILQCIHQFWLHFHKRVEDSSVQLIKCYKGQLYINIQDKATSVVANVPNYISNDIS